MVAAGPGSRRRARMLRTTSAEWTPSASASAQAAGLLGEHWHIMPGIVGRLAAAEATSMFADNRAVLADHDAIGISLKLDRPAHRARADRVLVVVKPHQAGLGNRGLGRVEPVE